MAITRQRTGTGKAATAVEDDGGDGTENRQQQRRRRQAATTAVTTTSTTLLTPAEAAEALELEALGGIDPATSFLYTPHTITGLFIGIALLVYYTGAFSSFISSSEDFDSVAAAAADAARNTVDFFSPAAVGARRGLAAALATWLLYCLLQGSSPSRLPGPLVRPHPAVWRLVHGLSLAYLLALVWLLSQQTAGQARGALTLFYPELGRPLPERSYGADCGLWVRKKGGTVTEGNIDAAAAAPAAAAAAAAAAVVSSSSPSSPSSPSSSSSSFFSPFFSSVSSSLFSSFPLSTKTHELNLGAIKSTLLDEFVLAHTLGWWAKAVLVRDRRLLWPLSVGFELCELALAHALPNFNECWWDSWVLDVAVCNLLGMEAGMATAALLRRRDGRLFRRDGEGGGGSGGGSGALSPSPSSERVVAWGGVSTKRGALAKAKRVAAQFSPRSWEERDWAPGKSPRRAGWALFIVGAFLLFDLNAFFLKAALWVPPLNPLTTYRLVLFFLLGLPAFKEFYHFVVAGEEIAERDEAEREERGDKDKKEKNDNVASSPSSSLPRNNNRLGPSAWLMLAIIAAETLVAVKFGPRLGPSGRNASTGRLVVPPRVAVAWAALATAALALAGTWLALGFGERSRRRRRRSRERSRSRSRERMSSSAKVR